MKMKIPNNKVNKNKCNKIQNKKALLRKMLDYPNLNLKKNCIW
jgi:hypothetical protein